MHIERVKLAVALLTFEVLILALFFEFVKYDTDADGSIPKISTGPKFGRVGEDKNSIVKYDSMFQDVHLMVFVGVGLLINFLRKYGYSAFGNNLMVGAVGIQWAILCRGIFYHRDDGYIPIEITTMINADFAAVTVLISIGAVLGVASPFELVITTIIEVFLYSVNEYIGTEIFKAADAGGSMYIHVFGAFFGLSLSRMLKSNDEINANNEAATRTSDLIAMIGTVFLWVYWPSFNACLSSGDDQHRAVVNTILSLTGSVLFTYAISILVSKDNKLSMVHMQNATLAGGVAVGAVVDLMIKPFGALWIGAIAGTISTLGYVYLTPFLQTKIGLHDTCGIQSLHGMPGIIGGLAGSIMAALASETDYGYSLYTHYPARAPLANTSELLNLTSHFSDIQAGDNRPAGTQALYQLAALGVTLVIAIGGGSTTGLILRAPMFGSIPKEMQFDDTFLWEVPGEAEPLKG